MSKSETLTAETISGIAYSVHYKARLGALLLGREGNYLNGGICIYDPATEQGMICDFERIESEPGNFQAHRMALMMAARLLAASEECQVCRSKLATFPHAASVRFREYVIAATGYQKYDLVVAIEVATQLMLQLDGAILGAAPDLDLEIEALLETSFSHIGISDPIFDGDDGEYFKHISPRDYRPGTVTRFDKGSEIPI